MAAFASRACRCGALRALVWRRSLITAPPKPSWSLRSLGVNLDRRRTRPAERPHMLTREKLEYMAELCQLDLQHGGLDAEQILTDVDDIMQCVRCVRAAAVANGDTVSSAGSDGTGRLGAAPLRPDVAMEEECDPEWVLANAKSREGDFYVVPQVLDDDIGGA